MAGVTMERETKQAQRDKTNTTKSSLFVIIRSPVRPRTVASSCGTTAYDGQAPDLFPSSQTNKLDTRLGGVTTPAILDDPAQLKSCPNIDGPGSPRSFLTVSRSILGFSRCLTIKTRRMAAGRKSQLPEPTTYVGLSIGHQTSFRSRVVMRGGDYSLLATPPNWESEGSGSPSNRWLSIGYRAAQIQCKSIILGGTGESWPCRPHHTAWHKEAMV